MTFKKIALFLGMVVASLPLHVQAELTYINEIMAIELVRFFANGSGTAVVACLYHFCKARYKLRYTNSSEHYIMHEPQLNNMSEKQKTVYDKTKNNT